MPRAITAFDLWQDQPERGGPPAFLAGDFLADRQRAKADAANAFRLLEQNKKVWMDPNASKAHGDDSDGVLMPHGKGNWDPTVKMERTKRKGSGLFVPKFVPSIEQVGDAVGIKGAGKNFLVSIDLSNKNWWCRDPRHPMGPGLPPDPMDPTMTPKIPGHKHPALMFAFNMRHINVTLKDKGTMANPDDKVIWDAQFGKQHAIKDINSTVPVEGGDMPEMNLLCPKLGEVHQYELTVSGQDHRVKPPKGRERGLDETVVFEGEIGRPGSIPRQRRPPVIAAGPGGVGPDGEGGPERVPGSFSPFRRGPFVESAPDPVVAALLTPSPWFCRQDHRKVTTRSAAFL